MRPPEEDMLHRRPVWQALSDLYLDTVLDPAAEGYNIQILAASPYTRDELETILREEVHPVCAANLYSVAGEWTFFNIDELQLLIFKWRQRSRLSRSILLRVGFLSAAMVKKAAPWLEQAMRLRETAPQRVAEQNR